MNLIKRENARMLGCDGGGINQRGNKQQTPICCKQYLMFNR